MSKILNILFGYFTTPVCLLGYYYTSSIYFIYAYFVAAIISILSYSASLLSLYIFPQYLTYTDVIKANSEFTTFKLCFSRVYLVVAYCVTYYWGEYYLSLMVAVCLILSTLFIHKVRLTVKQGVI
jgi:hypothetical protein